MPKTRLSDVVTKGDLENKSNLLLQFTNLLSARMMSEFIIGLISAIISFSTCYISRRLRAKILCYAMNLERPSNFFPICWR